MLHICFDIPTGAQYLQASCKVKSRIQPALALVYRGDASQRSACAPADQRYRHPPSTLSLWPEADRTGFSMTFLRWQAQRVLGHFTRKPFRQSLKKQRYANPGLGGKPDPNRFIFFIPIDTRLKIIQHVVYSDQQRRISSASISASTVLTASIFSCTRHRPHQ